MSVGITHCVLSHLTEKLEHLAMPIARLGVVCVGCLVFTIALPTHANARAPLNDFLQSLWPEAQALGVSRATFDRALRGVKLDRSLPDLVLAKKKTAVVKQAEFTRPPRAYLNAKTLGRLASTGRRLGVKHKVALDKIERDIGVDRFTVLAIWGRETSFGRYKLPHDAIRVLVTQAYMGRRADFFRNELLYALKMLEDGVPRKKMRSSWAGAIGQTQFLPSEYYKHAQSLGGGSRGDLFDRPEDALASAARQLKNKGWVSGQTWGYEVVIPPSASCALEGPPGTRTLRAWKDLGFRRVAGRKLPERMLETEAYLMSPAGTYGPSFLVLENFKVFRRYNTSDLYATFVGNLADRIAGGGDFVTPWKGQGRQRTNIIRAIQQGLKDKGYPIGKVDGFIGSGTRRQVGLYQKTNNLKIDCWPTAAVLAHIRQNSP